MLFVRPWGLSEVKPCMVKPKIFISHGSADEALLDELESFLLVLDTEPVRVIKQPNLGKTVNKKVTTPLDQADCIIIVATADNEDRNAKDKFQPRANVSHEIGYGQGLAKKIIYLKERNVEFGSNYQDCTWHEFESNSRAGIYPVLPKILFELKAFGLVSIGGKIDQDYIRSSITDQLYELVRLLGIENQQIKAQFLHLLGKSLLTKGKDLTNIEIEELQEIYPEIRQTCALDGYKNKNLLEAKRFLSFSLEINPNLETYYDYLDILFNSFYQGEGNIDSNILKEVEDLALKILRLDSGFNSDKFLTKVIFFSQYLSEQTFSLLITRLVSADSLPTTFKRAFKSYIFDNLQNIETEYLAEFKRYEYFDKPPILIYSSKQIKSPFLYNNKAAESYQAFGFLAKHFEPEDSNRVIELLDFLDQNLNSSDTVSEMLPKALWLLGKVEIKIDIRISNLINKIFNSKNHKHIGILATALGRKKIRNYNDELIKALSDFHFDSRRRIIWAMGEIGSQSFSTTLQKLNVDSNNYSLSEEKDKALAKLAKKDHVNV